MIKYEENEFGLEGIHMALNFCFEIAALVIGIILCIVSFSQYKITDLKGKVYVYMLRIVTLMSFLNLTAAIAIKRNLIFFLPISELVINLSLIMIVLLCFGLNLYLIETLQARNKYRRSTYVILAMPVIVQILLLLNWKKHTIFTLENVDERLLLSFDAWYIAPYILAMLSLLVYVVIAIKNRRIILEKKRNILFVIPFFVVAFYYLQYHFPNIAMIGFGHTVILLLLYLYAFHRSIKRDSLTRLPDGSSFKRMLDYRIGRQKSMTIAMITLDDFKQVNREYGYENGNRYLQLIANYIKEHAPKDSVSRYSGDKFAVVFDGKSCDDVREWCDELLSRFESAWEIGKLRHKLSACISLVEYPSMADSSEQIFDLLELMNIYGKRNKRNQCIICNDDFKKDMERRLRIASILNEVVNERKMHVEYQPILDVQANVYNRAEALFRMVDEELGNVPPAEFFPIAEENGYIVDVGYILLEQVCQYIRTFQDRSIAAPIISVNLFRQQIMDEKVDEKVAAILSKYEIQPNSVAFELPESVFLLQYEKVKEQVLRLHKLGCRFYLDGFGNAISDLSKLMELPFEVIKFNKKILKDAENNDSIYLLVSAMTAVLEESDKMILGDGIDSAHMKEMADLLFMDFLQGHYLCKPVTGDLAYAEFAKRDVFEVNAALDDLLKEIDIDNDKL